MLLNSLPKLSLITRANTVVTNYETGIYVANAARWFGPCNGKRTEYEGATYTSQPTQYTRQLSGAKHNRYKENKGNSRRKKNGK